VQRSRISRKKKNSLWKRKRKARKKEIKFFLGKNTLEVEKDVSYRNERGGGREESLILSRGGRRAFWFLLGGKGGGKRV